MSNLAVEDIETPNCGTVDYEKLMVHVESDTHMLEQLVALFRDFYPSQRDVIKHAIDRNDLSQFQEATRYLRGAVSNFHAPNAELVLQKLLGIRNRETFDSATDLISKLDTEIDLLFDALTKICESELN